MVASLFHLTEQAYRELGLGKPLNALLKTTILSDPFLLEQAVDVAIVNLIRAARLSKRAGIKARDGVGQQFLFSDWPLADGTALAQATKEQLQEAANRYDVLAKGNARGGWFLRSVARNLEEGQQVHEVWTEEELAKLWEQSKTMSNKEARRNLFSN